MNFKSLKDEFNYRAGKVADFARDVKHGIGFSSFPKGANTVLTGYFLAATALNVAAAGPVGLVSTSALFAGIGVGYAWWMGKNHVP